MSIGAFDGNELAYWHIVPSVVPGQPVVAYRTVIGRIQQPWEHVHLAEARGGRFVNPLRPGALGPYADPTRPIVTAVLVERDGEPVEGAVSGNVDLIAEAHDEPPLRPPTPWGENVLTPALLRWRIVTGRGRAVTGWQAAYDVRATLPSEPYGSVYARGTRQNRPSWPGLYRFLLAEGWPSTHLPTAPTASRSSSRTREGTLAAPTCRSRSPTAGDRTPRLRPARPRYTPRSTAMDRGGPFVDA